MSHPTKPSKEKRDRILFLIIALILGYFIFASPAWLSSIGELNTFWKVIVYIILTGAGAVIAYWPRGSRPGDIQRSDFRKILGQYAIIALAVLIIFGLVGWYINATT